MDHRLNAILNSVNGGGEPMEQMKTSIRLRKLSKVTALATFLGVTPGCGLDVNGLGPQLSVVENSYSCQCTCTDAVGGMETTSFLDKNDADETANGTVNIVRRVRDLGLVLVGLRFPNLGIPRGATIVSAEIQFSVYFPTNGATNLVINGQAIGNAPPFTATNNDVSNRAKTTQFATWNVPPWPTVGEAGAAEQTPNLSNVLQEIVSRGDWVPGNAVAFLISGTGSRQASSANSQFGQQAPILFVKFQAPLISQTLQVCLPDALNPNKNGGVNPTTAQLISDCQNRVLNTLHGLAFNCNYPSSCTCAALDSQRYESQCDTPCAAIPLSPDCSNFDPKAGNITATNAPGNLPVCTVHSPLTAAVFGRRSTCQVSGQAEVDINKETKKPAASGTIDFSGTPCPGAACSVGMSYDLTLAPITFSNTFGSATFDDLAALGESLPGGEAALTATGTGTFGPNTTQTSAHGRRGNDSKGLIASNHDVINIGVTWQPGVAACTLNGGLVGNADPEIKNCENAGPDANKPCMVDSDCTPDPACSGGVCHCQSMPPTPLTVSVNLAGPIVNQPPTANAGGNRTVECNLPAQASFILLGAASSDPDNNIATFEWLSGGRSGPEVSLVPNPTLTQALATSISYVLRVIDTFGQADEDSATVRVVDTTPPTIACNAPPTIRPFGEFDRPVVFTALAQDVCDPQATAKITASQCFRLTKHGPVPADCELKVNGATLTIRESGDVGTHIQWTVQAGDATGNTSAANCEVIVAR
jgi:hypothetical protein